MKIKIRNRVRDLHRLWKILKKKIRISMAGKASVRGSLVFQGVMGWKLLWVSPVKVWGKNNTAYQKKTGSL